MIIKTNAEVKGRFIAKSRIDGKPIYDVDDFELNKLIKINEYNFFGQKNYEFDLIPLMEDHSSISRQNLEKPYTQDIIL